MLHLWVFVGCISYSMASFAASANVILIAKDAAMSFQDIEANFAPSVRDPGICGTISIAEPLDACSPLTNPIVSSMNGTRYPFVLIIRGGCSFEHKVRRAQAAGFEAAILYNNQTTDLVAMAGNPLGIHINAVFVSKASGETMSKYVDEPGMQLWIVPSYESNPWSLLVCALFAFLGLSAILATCSLVRRQRLRHMNAVPVREFEGISIGLVKAMPCLTFTSVLEDNCTSQTCAICLEDYNVGDKLRLLPCHHKFHAVCVDTWLTSWRTFCPICKRDLKAKATKPSPPSDSTPLLSSTSSSPSSSVSESRSIVVYNHHILGVNRMLQLQGFHST